MDELLFLVPLVIGVGIMALGFRMQMPRGIKMNRAAFGCSLIVGSVFCWLSTAMLLAREGEFYFILNMLTVLTFFAGLAFFFPQPPNATRPNQLNKAATMLVWLGIVAALFN